MLPSPTVLAESNRHHHLPDFPFESLHHSNDMHLLDPVISNEEPLDGDEVWLTESNCYS